MSNRTPSKTAIPTGSVIESASSIEAAKLEGTKADLPRGGIGKNSLASFELAVGRDGRTLSD
jgi:hypothetical protein